MTVAEMMRKLQKEDRDVDFCDDYDERAYVAYCCTPFSEKALKKYADGFNLEIDEENTDLTGNYQIVIVKCQTAKDAEALRKLLYSMAGYLEPEEEYNELYPEPEEEPEPERSLIEIILTNERGVIMAKQIEFEDGILAIMGADGEWRKIDPQDVLRIIGG